MTNGPVDPRAAVHATLDALRRDGVIDAGDENAVVRHFDDHAHALKEALDAIAPEYRRRVRDEGQAGADRWLAATAEAMGRQDGQAARQLLASVGR